MSEWQVVAADSLASAKVLRSAGHHRSSCSRAYYAAYAMLAGALDDQGYMIAGRFGDNPGHDQLMKMVKNNLGGSEWKPRRVQVGRDLIVLRSFRVVSDYDPKGTIEGPESLECVRREESIARALGSTS